MTGMRSKLSISILDTNDADATPLDNDMMGNAMSLPNGCRQLTDLVEAPDTALDIPMAELAAMQLRAVGELFAERREQIPVLRDRARDEGVTEIGTKQDIVPLLFSHTTYKSYPESFIHAGKWGLLGRWYATLSAVPIEVDFTGVNDIDQWVDRMWSAGHYVYATSGTTGKCSFLNHTKGDRDFVERFWSLWSGWPSCLDPERDRMRFYAGVPSEGPQAPMHWYKHLGDTFGKPGERFYLGDEPVRVSHLNRVGKMRKAMADGTADAADVAAFEAEMAEREKAMIANIERMADDIIEHRHEPLWLGVWQVMSDVLDVARKRGIPDGDFRDVFVQGSARKKFRGDMDLLELDAAAMRLFGDAVRPRNMFYGMTELGTVNPMCEHGRYHLTPWTMLLLLDRNGNWLVEKEGELVEGRAAFVDLSREGRWGGVISGDRMTVDFAATCKCGRPGPGILDNSISRYSDANDDKVDCAGSFDAYVRGAMEKQ